VPDALLGAAFCCGAAVSLCSSWVLVSRLERIGARLGLSEALLGMLAALAADTPEITAAVTAMARGQSRIGAGVVIGSNVFNLAALLGFAAVVAGGIFLHRRVIATESFVALWIAVTCLAVVLGVLPAAAGLAIVLVVFMPYLILLSSWRGRLRRLGLPATWMNWLMKAVTEEEQELEVAIHPRRGRTRDWIEALVAVALVVGASVAMESSASTLGVRHAIPEIVVGGLILAGVTSLPNAVAAVYLAARGRGAATLSTAMNSNALNVTVGLLLPATIIGLGAPSGQAALVAAWYLGLTAFALASAYLSRGLRRPHGVLIICAYLVFVGVVIATAYGSHSGWVISLAVLVVGAAVLVPQLLRSRRRQADRVDSERAGERSLVAGTESIQSKRSQ
jgi:cation:H+ antiporter